jgi:hypothetical protein
MSVDGLNFDPNLPPPFTQEPYPRLRFPLESAHQRLTAYFDYAAESPVAFPWEQEKAALSPRSQPHPSFNESAYRFSDGIRIVMTKGLNRKEIGIAPLCFV